MQTITIDQRINATLVLIGALPVPMSLRGKPKPGQEHIGINDNKTILNAHEKYIAEHVFSVSDESLYHSMVDKGMLRHLDGSPLSKRAATMFMESIKGDAMRKHKDDVSSFICKSIDASNKQIYAKLARHGLLDRPDGSIVSWWSVKSEAARLRKELGCTGISDRWID